MRPDSLKEVVARVRGDADFVLAINEFLDEFYLAAHRQPMIDDDPGLLGPKWRDRICGPIDAYVGAVGEHLARRWGLRIPEWIDQPQRFLDEPFFVGNVQLLKAEYLAFSPLAFRRRLIFTEAEPLRRARFPGAAVQAAPPQDVPHSAA